MNHCERRPDPPRRAPGSPRPPAPRASPPSVHLPPLPWHTSAGPQRPALHDLPPRLPAGAGELDAGGGARPGRAALCALFALLFFSSCVFPWSLGWVGSCCCVARMPEGRGAGRRRPAQLRPAPSHRHASAMPACTPPSPQWDIVLDNPGAKYFGTPNAIFRWGESGRGERVLRVHALESSPPRHMHPPAARGAQRPARGRKMVGRPSRRATRRLAPSPSHAQREVRRQERRQRRRGLRRHHGCVRLLPLEGAAAWGVGPGRGGAAAPVPEARLP